MTTFLSIIPNISGASVDRDRLHKEIWRAFPGHPPGVAAPFTFRVDDVTATILVRSQERPEWHLPGIRVIEENHPWQVGDVVQVDVHLSPYRRNKGREIPMAAEEEEEYVVRRLQRAGLAPLTEADEDDLVQIERPLLDVRGMFVDFRTNTRVPLAPRRVIGMCTIENGDALHAVLRNGIGGRKSFLGFGMLLLYPPDVIVV